MMLDEVDKLGRGIQGDPSSALLEVLDPEQNSTFRDNYLGVPFDLSRVMFITTANVLDTIPGPLRDRMEVIDLPGYVEDEKLEIARRYLVERQLKANGLKAEQAEITDAALRAIIRDYTREAGVRQLEREIGAVLRSVAMRIAEDTAQQVRIEPSDLKEILGPPRFESEVAMRTSIPGVATGLAWTPVGGDILFIEATRIPGSGRLILTGQLGEVMRESAQAALSFVKGKASGLGLDPAMFEKSDIHIHVPAGAIPKDGPSAGVAMYTALVSLLTDRTVRSDTAMTGEISLRGLVLPVGGIKEKVVAAARAGLSTVILPARNRKDYEEIPESARNALRFLWAERVEDVVEAALEPGPPAAAAPSWSGLQNKSNPALVMKRLLLLILAVLPFRGRGSAGSGWAAGGRRRARRAAADHPDRRVHRPHPADRPGGARRAGHRVSRKAAVCRGRRGQEGRSPLSARAAAVSGAGGLQQSECRAARSAAHALPSRQLAARRSTC